MIFNFTSFVKNMLVGFCRKFKTSFITVKKGQFIELKMNYNKNAFFTFSTKQLKHFFSSNETFFFNCMLRQKELKKYLNERRNILTDILTSLQLKIQKNRTCFWYYKNFVDNSKLNSSYIFIEKNDELCSIIAICLFYQNIIRNK